MLPSTFFELQQTQRVFHIKWFPGPSQFVFFQDCTTTLAPSLPNTPLSRALGLLSLPLFLDMKPNIPDGLLSLSSPPLWDPSGILAMSIGSSGPSELVVAVGVDLLDRERPRLDLLTFLDPLGVTALSL